MQTNSKSLHELRILSLHELKIFTNFHGLLL